MERTLRALLAVYRNFAIHHVCHSPTCGMDARLTFRLDEQVAASLARLARRNERSTGAELRRAVKAHLIDNDNDPPSRAGRVTTSSAGEVGGHGRPYSQ